MADVSETLTAVMVELAEMRGEQRTHNSDMLRRLNDIETGLVSRSEFDGLSRCVDRHEAHIAWAIRGVVTAIIGSVAAAFSLHHS